MFFVIFIVCFVFEDSLEASFISERGKFLETGISSPEYDSLIEKFRLKRYWAGAGSVSSNSAFGLDGSEVISFLECSFFED